MGKKCWWDKETNQLQQFSDGISYYAARAINSQVLRSYSVFFAGQIGLVLVTLVGLIKHFGQTFASDKTKDEAPSELKSTASTGAKFTSGGLMWP